MVMDIIPKSLYPVVPFAPGIPAMARDVARIAESFVPSGLLKTQPSQPVIAAKSSPRWGVYDSSGRAVAIADSVLSFDYRNSSRVSDYPVEQGAFASYNKVATPYDARVRMARNGGESARADFISALDAAARSTDLYTILTPDAVYRNANIEALDYRREVANGAGVIVAELYLREVREAPAAAFNAPKSPSAEAVRSQGQLQPITPDVSLRDLTRARQIS